MIDAYCSMPHHVDHVAPILAALPDDVRGEIYGPRALYRHPVNGVHVRTGNVPRSDTHPLLVAGVQDLTVARRPKVFVEHGAGQRYEGVEWHPSYAGGQGRELAGLFLCPREDVAQRNADAYPAADCVVVGCPKLDAWQQIPAPQNDRPVVAVAFHWNCALVPESGWAFPTYRDAIAKLATWYTVLGHGHPRARDLLAPWYAQQGIEAVWSPTELLERASVLVADNTSLMYEWAACGRPVVALNDPSWRRDVEHGLRFWEYIPGVAIDHPHDLPAMVKWVSEECTSPWPDVERHLTAYVYGGCADGLASERAAAAIIGWMER